MLWAFAWVATIQVSRAEEVGSDMRIGVLSDIHVHLVPGENPAKNGSLQRFRKALEYFRDRKVDGVLVCGDLTDQGLDIELKAVADAWFDVFPGGRAQDGSPVVNLMHYGDHDAEVRFWTPREKNLLAECERLGVTPVRSLAVGENRKSCWEAFFHEAWQPVQIKKVKGRTFVLAHFVRETVGWNEGLADILASTGVATNEPFFYSQHRPFRGTWHAKWGEDAGKNENVLARYPNAVVFSGHTHYTQTDDRMVWQKGFTAISVGALKNQYVDRHHENGVLIPWIKTDSERDLDMPCVRVDSCHSGMLMSIQGDHVVMERRDFETGLALGPDIEFDVDVPARLRGESVSAASRKLRRLMPVFPSDATIRALRTQAISRRKRKFDAVRLEFPVANAAGGHPRAYDYRVCAIAEDGRIVKERRVFSPSANRPEAFDKGPVFCLFDVKDLGGAVRFTVEARSCWGAVTAPLAVDYCLGKQVEPAKQEKGN